MNPGLAPVERLTALLLLVSASLAVVIVLYATLHYYDAPTSTPLGRFISILIALGGLAALASLTISTFRHFLQPALENGTRRVRKRNA